MKFCVFAPVAAGGLVTTGLSGGDRIIIEVIKRWGDSLNVVVYTGMSGHKMYRRYLANAKIDFDLLPTPTSQKSSLVKIIIFEFIALFEGLLAMRRFNPEGKAVIYSASDFLPDFLPCLLLKRKHRQKIVWIATFWLFAPNPLSKNSPYKGLSRIRNLFYFISQMLVYPLTRKYADMVWVTNELDRWRFIDEKRLTPEKVITVKGGVDAKTPSRVPEPKEKTFDAVFIGRFHPQKGVLELIDIWKLVCEQKPDANLAIIGVGDLEGEIKRMVKKYGLERNVVFFGFKNGLEKIKIFKKSKIALYPATLDHWSMAPVEAMSAGLPLISFDLATLRILKPKGVVVVPWLDLEAFANAAIEVINDRVLHERLKQEAIEFAKEWDWDTRAKGLLKDIAGLLTGEM